MTKPKTAKTPAQPAPLLPVDKTRHLEVICVPGKTDDRMLADLVTDGLASNASTAIRFIKPELGDVSLTEMVASLQDQGEAVNRGDLGSLERMLNGQAVALNAMFAELARRGALNMGERLDAMDRYFRLALKAQSQARATVETLAAIKNPPVVFARQVNVANGPQQVNNGAAPNGTPANAHPGETASRPNELLEDMTHGRTQLDPATAPATSRSNPTLEPVGAVNRAAHR